MTFKNIASFLLRCKVKFILHADPYIIGLCDKIGIPGFSFLQSEYEILKPVSLPIFHFIQVNIPREIE
jgi:hypothetical protein